MQSTTIQVADEELRLLPARGVYWPRARTLFVADLHLGKPAAFRSAGIPVPEAATAADLDRLGRLIDATGAERLVVLGDLLHARAGRSPEVIDAVAAWRGARGSLAVALVRGNHDRSAGDPPEAWGIECLSGPALDGPFVLMHEPAADARGYVMSGHIHPAVRLTGPAGSTLRAACFWVGPRCAVLPAFGAFTGAKVVQPRVGDRVFVVGDGSVMEVKLAPRSAC